jgi:hypothetical protein
LIYFGRTYTATVSGSRTLRERCVNCSHTFEYDVTCVSTGYGRSPYFLINEGVAAGAKKHATANLDRALDNPVAPVHCPYCGIFQPSMVRMLRMGYGKHFDPNKHAHERIGVPPEDTFHAAYKAFDAAAEADTLESYAKFRETWPEYRWPDIRIKELTPRSQKLFSRSFLFWLMWSAIILFFIACFAIAYW